MRHLHLWSLGTRMLWSLSLGTAGALHLWNPATFQDRVAAYDLFPVWGTALVAVVVPVAELICGLAAWIPSYRRPATWLGLSLVAIFAGAVSSALVRGLDISCGCVGELQGSLWGALAFDLVLALSLIIHAYATRASRSQPHALPPPSTSSS